MLSEAAANSDSITSSSVNAPRSEVQSESLGQVIGVLKTRIEVELDRRRVVKESSWQWYALGAVRPSSGESFSQYGVRIPTVSEEGQLENVPVVAPSCEDAGPSRFQSSAGNGMKTVSQTPVKLPGQFAVSSPSASSRKRSAVEDPNFASALASQSPRGKHQKTVPVFQGGFP